MTSTRLGLTTGLAAILVLLGLAAPAMAQEATNLGTFNDWTAWKSRDANGEICYISSAPQTTEPEGVRRGSINFLVIHREKVPVENQPGQFRKIRNEVQGLFGYPLRESPSPSATIDGKTYEMVPIDEAGWLASSADEPGFVEALKAGAKLVVRGRSTRGTDTIDTYSLRGVTAAMGEIDKACT